MIACRRLFYNFAIFVNYYLDFNLDQNHQELLDFNLLGNFNSGFNLNQRSPDLNFGFFLVMNQAGRSR
jgi:hypothetical protein